MGGYCYPGGVAVWNQGIFLARYPEFSAVNPNKLAAYFIEAGLYLSNQPNSPVCDVNVRLMFLNMIVAHIGFLAGDTAAPIIAPIPPSVVLNVTSTAPGGFSVPHGLGVVPSSMNILPTSGGTIWAQNPPFDATYVYLDASDVDVSATVTVFQTTQASSSGGQIRPVGRVNTASEGSVSAGFDYTPAEPGSGAWFNQSQYGAAFWQATANLRGMRYSARPTRVNIGWPRSRVL